MSPSAFGLHHSWTGDYDMRFGCFASLALYIVVALLMVPDGLPLLLVAVCLVGVIVIANRWLRSDWPLF